MTINTNITEHFRNMEDPRVQGRIRHNLIDIITIVLCGVISGADTFSDIELFAKCKAPFFESFLELPGGIPSHDTLNRVMSSLDTKQFSECFASWIRNIGIKGVVAIDGKTERRSFN